MLILFFITLTVIIFLIWLFRRDQRFLKKSVKDVVGNDMKKLLNIKHPEASFDKNFDSVLIKKRKSRELLEEMNDPLQKS